MKWFEKTAADSAPGPDEGLNFSNASEYGTTFETGRPVQFDYIRNTESAPYLGSEFGQDIEPHGRYLLQAHPTAKPTDNWEMGTVSFQNPLVIDFGGSTGHSGWKGRLEAYYKKKGKALSRAIRKDGYDAIVTVEDGYTVEIVDLTGGA
jgi:hypothetical protein